MTLLAIALALTLPTAGHGVGARAADWGPVTGAYLATLLLGAAYIAIGSSSRPVPTTPSWP